MENDNCPNCKHNPVLDAIQTRFREGILNLLSQSIAESHGFLAEEQPEQCDRRDGFSIELADDLLYMAAKVYDFEGVPNSEAIYQLAQELERVESEGRGDNSPEIVNDPVEELPPSSDVN